MILRFIKRLFRVQYRLSVYFDGETEPRNTYGTKGRLLVKMAKSMNACYWSLYKSGPFFLAEREINKGMKGEKA